MKPCSPGPATLFLSLAGNRVPMARSGWTRHHAGDRSTRCVAVLLCATQLSGGTITSTIYSSAYEKHWDRLQAAKRPPHFVISIERVCQNDSTATSPAREHGELRWARARHCEYDWSSLCAVKLLNPSQGYIILYRTMYLPALLPPASQVSGTQSRCFD